MEVEKHDALQFSNHGFTFKKLTIYPKDRLVEESKSGNVPNHLLETKIFTTIQRNKVIEAVPAILHFGGYELGKHHQQILKLVNVSSTMTNVHILPPQTKYFQVRYIKKNHLVPGMSFNVTVNFCPNEWRYYYDSIRIHCKDDDALLVPLHAYPVANIVEFPTYLTVGDVPLGQSKEINIPLRCSCPVDFEFQISFLQSHRAFTIQPTAGIIPANGQVDIVVKYTPLDRATAQIGIQLFISQFNSKPYTCTIIGTSSPRLGFRSQDKDEKFKVTFTKKLLDPESLSPMQISRKKRHQKMLQDQSSGKEKSIKPVDLFNPHAVAIVLNEQPGKLRIKDLRNVLTNVQGGSKSRQAKAAMFNQKVKKDVMMEQANQLRWQTHLGRDPISPEAMQLILENRQIAEEEYKIHLDVPVPEKECERHDTKVSLKRVLRSIGQLPSPVPEFDPYSNNPWQVRHRALKHFQQAARKIIIQCRVNHRLILLQKLVKNLKRRHESKLSLKESSLLSIGRTAQESEDRYYFEIGDIQPFTFPYYVSPDWKDELAADALGPVSVRPSEVVIDQVVPFFNLKVYQRYKQMEYEPYSTQYVSSSYLPLTLSRPLRSGAEDELYLILPTKKTDAGTEASMDELHEKHHHVESKAKHITTKTSILSLKPPQGLIKQPEYHPLYVFNAAPDLCANKRPFSFAETDTEYHLCPLPRYQTTNKNGTNVSSTQKKFLDRDEIIKGVMTWKKFPSAALLSLSNSDFLTSTWVPRWFDVFPSDMLPVNAPTQLDGLPIEDRENIAMESSEEVGLTPEMLEAEFTMIESPVQLPESPKDETAKDDGEPLKANLSQTSFTDEIVTREKREEQLNQWLESNNNRLGSSIQLRIEQLRELCINKHLLLK